jgi:hypothetical protein
MAETARRKAAAPKLARWRILGIRDTRLPWPDKRRLVEDREYEPGCSGRQGKKPVLKDRLGRTDGRRREARARTPSSGTRPSDFASPASTGSRGAAGLAADGDLAVLQVLRSMRAQTLLPVGPQRACRSSPAACTRTRGSPARREPSYGVVTETPSKVEVLTVPLMRLETARPTKALVGRDTVPDPTRVQATPSTET